MRRALVYFVQVAVLAAAAVWLADHPGRVEIDWLGYRVETYFGVLLALLLVAALLFDGARRAWRLLAGAPGDFVARRRTRRREDGFRALTHGMAAVAAGDRDEARRLARRADTLLRDPGVTGCCRPRRRRSTATRRRRGAISTRWPRTGRRPSSA